MASRKRKAEDEVEPDVSADQAKAIIIKTLQSVPTFSQTDKLKKVLKELDQGVLRVSKRHQDQPPPDVANHIRRFLDFGMDHNQIYLTSRPDESSKKLLTVTFEQAQVYAQLVEKINDRMDGQSDSDKSLGAFAVSFCLAASLNALNPIRYKNLDTVRLMLARAALRALVKDGTTGAFQWPRILPLFGYLSSISDNVETLT